MIQSAATCWQNRMYVDGAVPQTQNTWGAVWADIQI